MNCKFVFSKVNFVKARTYNIHILKLPSNYFKNGKGEPDSEDEDSKLRRGKEMRAAREETAEGPAVLALSCTRSDSWREHSILTASGLLKLERDRIGKVETNSRLVHPKEGLCRSKQRPGMQPPGTGRKGQQAPRPHAQHSHGVVHKVPSDSRAAGSVCTEMRRTSGPHGPLRLPRNPGDCVRRRPRSLPGPPRVCKQAPRPQVSETKPNRPILSTWNSETLSLLKAHPSLVKAPRHGR